MNSAPKFRMKYVETELVDFDEMLAKTVISNEVRSTGNVYTHKPLKNQGRFASGKTQHACCTRGR
jgi:hypothetical protein